MTKLNIPYSIEAEQAVLGGLMLDNGTFDEVIDILQGNDFYRHDHRLVFNAIEQLYQAKQPFDILTLSEKLLALKVKKDDEVLVYLAEIARNTPSAANIKAYCQIVKERSRLRSLINYGNTISQEASKKQASSSQLLELADQQLFELSQTQQGNKDFADLTEVLSSIVDKIDSHFNNGDPVTGVTTGLTELDLITSGLQPSDLIILGARPAMGKTSLALKMALAAVENLVKEIEKKQQLAEPIEAKHVLIYSLEMPTEQLILRCIAQIGKLNLQALRTGQLNPDNSGINEFDQLTVAISKINSYQNLLIIDDTAGLTIAAIRSQTKRSVRKYGKPVLILVDYLQLINGTGKYENRNNEISSISRELKALAKEFNCPVVALSQLNRSLEQRANKRPIMADLRDSGAVEQDADVIMFVYRDEVYHPESADAGIAEIIIGKQRNGPIGTVRTSFHADQTAFQNLSIRNY